MWLRQSLTRSCSVAVICHHSLAHGDRHGVCPASAQPFDGSHPTHLDAPRLLVRADRRTAVEACGDDLAHAYSSRPYSRATETRSSNTGLLLSYITVSASARTRCTVRGGMW